MKQSWKINILRNLSTYKWHSSTPPTKMLLTAKRRTLGWHEIRGTSCSVGRTFSHWNVIQWHPMMKGWQGEPFVGVARSGHCLKNSHMYVNFVFEFNYCSVFLSSSLVVVWKRLVEMLHALSSKSNWGGFTRNKKRIKLASYEAAVACSNWVGEVILINVHHARVHLMHVFWKLLSSN